MQTCRTLRTRALIFVTIAVASTLACPAAALADAGEPGPVASLSSVSPANGAVSGGAVVTVSGRNLTGATSVAIGGVPVLSFVAGSSGQLSVVTPVLPVGTHTLTVTTAAGTATGASYRVRTVEDEVLRLVNKARATKRSCGSKTYKAVPALRADAKLARVAAEHSADMSQQDFFSHTSRNGDSPFDRIKGAGYLYRYAGENIAAGFRTPASVTKAWLKSPGHCRNIMKASYTELGVGWVTGGAYGSYWTQDFGRPR